MKHLNSIISIFIILCLTSILIPPENGIKTGFRVKNQIDIEAPKTPANSLFCPTDYNLHLLLPPESGSSISFARKRSDFAARKNFDQHKINFVVSNGKVNERNSNIFRSTKQRIVYKLCSESDDDVYPLV